ncbi:MAG: hypothetical protein L0Y66_20375 [Myxococcaceae bacterium]|nr:hypothetical protein [Myxococcaceae bacterium]MCI0670047.1 hypothetical protein [Myxococcaceae bacterium]
MPRRLLLLLLPAALSGCPRAPPEEDRGPAPVRIPEGCEAPLGGEWRHADVPSWRYSGEDDGGTLVLVVSRAGPDGGEGQAPGAGPRIELHRTGEGFRGRVVDSSFGPGDTPCTVTFPTEVLACGDGGLTLSTTSATVVDEQCRPAPQTTPVRREVHRLVRPGTEPQGAADAGEGAR